ncbi:MAG TPA: hypothetical protein RMH85_05185 [Polyangiaceae bacterium LLY-WYZ-15_(1-7)]|nr:hypothetical protein [Myxococcales bacterium]MAT26193.1 hypothetical protein [Sandaracinus sp.]HJK91675.1 hypothetical protein [Polyangiaceae bacterium LLY-WYZ-15_(1-7)]HJL05070.1 hypothetical protein [Polyangiaceae bacterium LLY-WYZ-15_(1-7)]HJL07866.1 hypothetical protein [Polyangiaceae bacterium LLY-WYZ-15_(1-7)]
MTRGYAIAAAVAVALALAVLVPVIRAASRPAQRRQLLLFGALQLPMAALLLYGVRGPLLRPLWRALAERFDPSGAEALAAHAPDALARSPLLAALLAIEAPLSEELGKVFPLLLVWAVPAWRARLAPAHEGARVPLAMAVGLGFGLGEIVLLAHLGSASPAVRDLPWHALSGFIGERAIVCFLHGALTAAAIHQLGRGAGRLALGLFASMALHALLNLPVILGEVGAFGLAKKDWLVVSAIWLQLFLLGALAALRLAHTRRGGKRRAFLGRARCPSCDAVYDRPIFGLNFPHRRYERCGACGRWHWTPLRGVEE